MKTYRYKGYTAEPYKIEDMNWKVNVFGLCYYFRALSDFKNWVNNKQTR